VYTKISLEIFKIKLYLYSEQNQIRLVK